MNGSALAAILLAADAASRLGGHAASPLVSTGHGTARACERKENK